MSGLRDRDLSETLERSNASCYTRHVIEMYVKNVSVHIPHHIGGKLEWQWPVERKSQGRVEEESSNRDAFLCFGNRAHAPRVMLR
jgi:hypothetical protein